MRTTLFQFVLAGILSATSASAGVSAYSSGITSGFIKSVDVSVEAKIVGVRIVCGSETGVIKFDKKSYSEGLPLSSALGKFFRGTGFLRAQDANNVRFADYSLSEEQLEADLPGAIRCR